jgi:hypothetical protein
MERELALSAKRVMRCQCKELTKVIVIYLPGIGERGNDEEQ